jgi:cbb3-type cytochrome oxidase subunit 3
VKLEAILLLVICSSFLGLILYWFKRRSKSIIDSSNEE